MEILQQRKGGRCWTNAERKEGVAVVGVAAAMPWLDCIAKACKMQSLQMQIPWDCTEVI